MARDDETSAFVRAWLARAPADLSVLDRLDLLDGALDALWRRAFATLGEITLTAIADRVVYSTAERFPAAAPLAVEREGFRFDALRAHADELRSDEVAEWTRFMLVEFLTVLGNLTAEVLTPPLRAALLAVAPAAAAAETNGGTPRSPATAAKETKS